MLRCNCWMRARWLLVSVLCPHPPHPPQPPQVAIKWISKASITDMTEMDRVSREFFILTAIDHRNVIRLYEVLQDDAFLYLVMEFAGGGTLEGLLSSRPGGALLSEASSRALFSEVASAVRYCHRQSIVHRDLKPENILLARTDVAITPDVLATRPQELYTVKVADFGLSNTATVGTRARSPVGTPLFSAPEVLFPSAYPSLWADGGAAVAGGGPVAEEEEEGADAATPAPAPAPAAGAGGRGRAPLPTPVSTGRHGAAAAPAPVPGVNAAGHVVCSGAGKDYSGTMTDVWGMGVILYRMVTGVLPFPADSMKSLRAMILKKPLTFPPLPAPQLSPNLQALIRRMLTLDPFARPAADEVMAQPWLASTGLGLLGGDDDDDDGNMVPEPPPVDPAATSAADAEVATAGVEDLIAAAAEVEGASARGRAAAKRGSPVRSRSRVSGIDTSAAAEAAGGGGTSPTSRAGGGGALEVVGSSRAGAVPTSRSEAPPSGRTPSAARSGSVAGWPMNDAVGLDDSASTDGVGGGGGGAGGDGEERISIVSSRAGLPPATTRSSSQMSLAEGGIAAAGGRGIRRSEVGAEARAMRRSSAGGGGGGGEEAGGGSGTPAGGSGVVLFGGLSGAGGKHPNLRRVSGINTSAPSPGVMAVGAGAPCRHAGGRRRRHANWDDQLWRQPWDAGGRLCLPAVLAARRRRHGVCTRPAGAVSLPPADCHASRWLASGTPAAPRRRRREPPYRRPRGVRARVWPRRLTRCTRVRIVGDGLAASQPNGVAHGSWAAAAHHHAEQPARWWQWRQQSNEAAASWPQCQRPGPVTHHRR